MLLLLYCFQLDTMIQLLQLEAVGVTLLVGTTAVHSLSRYVNICARFDPASGWLAITRLSVQILNSQRNEAQSFLVPLPVTVTGGGHLSVSSSVYFTTLIL